MALKLYVWEDVFEMWWCSVVFALAENEEQARRLVREKIEATGGFGDESEEREFEEGFRKSPEVYSLPAACCVWGGY